ncbi:3'-5' exonuclease [Halomontanus rarus]|uniref:3'-5' exonuclease n=1 Tax=Halomontanus rarus TaxID=3034020 RepID=UPI0023E8DFE4|nr:3'-5' exonuclease [Halovivax sp. TS33]
MSTSGRLALDIETVDGAIPDGESFDAGNSTHVELFCVCVGFQPEPEAPADREVFFRDGWGPEAELDVLERTIDWLESKTSETVLTYNGDAFDLPHLEGRARIAAETLGDRADLAHRVERFVDGIDSVDLFPEAREAYEAVHDEWPSFEDACRACRVDVSRTELEAFDVHNVVDFPSHRSTTDAMKPYFIGADVPVVGATYLDLLEAGATDTKTFRELHAMLEHYSVTDVIPLFDLADRRPFEDAITATA